MFIKVVKYKVTGDPMSKDYHCTQESESLYECARYTKKNIKRNANKKGEEPLYVNDVLFDMEGSPDSGCISIQLERKNVSIYIMNNEGRTIDTYHYQ